MRLLHSDIIKPELYMPVILYGNNTGNKSITIAGKNVKVSKNKYDNYLVFKDKEELKELIISLFKIPGQYEFDESVKSVKALGQRFETEGFYFDLIEGSDDYIYYWEKEKERCMKGVFVYNNNNGKLFYFTGEYYMWLNYLPIFNKEKRTTTFPEIRDVQMYISLYRYLAELHNKHSIIVKKRQIASSYYHAAFLINKLWFIKGARLKLFAYSEMPYLSTTWDYIVQYRDFLNSNTAWLRHFHPDRRYNWVQQIEIVEDGIRKYKGLKSELKAKSLSDNPTDGVGGGNSYVFYEEAGIAPTMDKTYEYLMPSLKEGEVITGQFMAAGSVGSMDDCKPLQKYIYNPEVYDFYAVENNMIDSENSITKMTGCFIPQHWGMLPFIDEYGNSKVDEALEYLKEKRKEWSKKLTTEEYNIRVSQEPICLEEVFNYKKNSIFPVSLIKKHILKFEEKQTYRCVELERDDKGKVFFKNTNKIPITEYPLSPSSPYKEGAIQIFEDPRPELPFGTYIAGIDTVNIGATTSSHSLASIYVLRDEVSYINPDSKQMIVEPSGVVCCWTGRFDDLNKTNEQILRILEFYNAIGVVEADVAFTQYCIKHKKVKHLMRRDQFILFKEQDSKIRRSTEYGWRNTGDIFDKYMVPYLIQYMKEDFSETKDDGTYIPRYGIERIKDSMVLREMLYFEDGYNTDRVIALTSAITYMYILQTNRNIPVVRKREDKELTMEEIMKRNMERVIRKAKQIKQTKSFFNRLN